MQSRPLTHDLMKNSLELAGFKVSLNPLPRRRQCLATLVECMCVRIHLVRCGVRLRDGMPHETVGPSRKETGSCQAIGDRRLFNRNNCPMHPPAAYLW